MSRYSEKQLLMLSCFVYLPGSENSATIGEILERARGEKGDFPPQNIEYYIGTGGGMSSEEVSDLFTRMDEEGKNNPGFLNLSASRMITEGNIKAICYTDPKDNNPVVVFRGTGGTSEAWTDNFEGGYEQDTKMQSLAAQFVQTECSGYDNLVVTGHSKGGNLAQYISVMCGSVVSECVSFDGQGFSHDFINENKEKIEVSSPTIKSISAYNDYVNILLQTIAGTVVYVQNAEGIRNAHSPYSMLVSNEYDNNGDFVSERIQSPISAILKKMTSGLLNCIEPAKDADKKLLSYITGTTLATALEAEDKEGAMRAFAGFEGMVSTRFVERFVQGSNMIIGDRVPAIRELYFDMQGVLNVCNTLRELEQSVEKVRKHIGSLRDGISYTITARIYAGRILVRVDEQLSRIVHSIEVFVSTLETVAGRYEEKEKALTELLVMQRS